MGTISSGVGLVSGIDYDTLIDNLIKADSGPRNLLVTRMSTIDAQSTAYLEISARITAMLSRIESLARASTFNAAKATSSLPDVLSVTAEAGAPQGSYQFIVRALAASHQAVSRGFYDRTSPMSPGTLTIESAQAKVDRSTRLDELNGHTGVQRGKFKLTDANGQEATVNIADALTLGDVVEKINGAGLAIEASVRGDALVLSDTSVDGTEGLRVQEVGGGKTAASLGFGAGYRYDTDGDGEIVGSDIIYLAGTSPLAALNDGLGVRGSVAGNDFSIKIGENQINVSLGETLKPDTRLERLNHGQGVRLGTIRVTSRDGTFKDIDLTNATNITEVKDTIEGAFDDSRLTVVLTGSRLVITDKTKAKEGDETYAFKIEDLNGGLAARDLGIAGTATADKISGSDILHVDTLSDVLDAINYATGNEDANKQPLVTAAIDDSSQGLVLTSNVGGALTIEVPETSKSKALIDLGLQAGTYYDVGGGASVAGRGIVGGLNTTLLSTLNGGNGFTGGTIRLNGGGGSVDIDLSSAETLSDAVQLMNDAIESAGLTIDVGYDSTGTRLVVGNRDGGTSPITISDVNGDFAAATGLAQTGGEIRSNNLQRRYVAENTQLEDLNGGRGVALGKFKITNSRGAYATVNLGTGSMESLQDVIDAINGTGLGVTARINDTGDGLLITDENGGASTLTIEEQGSSTAHDLNILGAATDGRIDGAYEFKLTLGGSETLETLAARISSDTTLATASLLNDGTGTAPYRLNIAARSAGAAGELIIDDSDSDLGISTLTRAQDARILYGGDADSGILLTSSSNTFDNVVEGLTITVSSVSDQAVSVTVDQDVDGLVETMSGLVDDFNDAMSRIRELSDYDEETETAGVLLGEGTLQIVENRLFQMFSGSRTGTGSTYNRLSQLGLTFSEGNTLSFDETKFRAAYEADPDSVTRFFTQTENGAGVEIKKELDRIIGDTGLIKREAESLSQQKELLQERVEYMDDLLSRKRARLTAQFQGLESALTLMQSQTASLATLASMAEAV